MNNDIQEPSEPARGFDPLDHATFHELEACRPDCPHCQLEQQPKGGEAGSA